MVHVSRLCLVNHTAGPVWKSMPALQAELRLKEVEDLARRKVSQEYHARAISSLEQQLNAAKKAGSSQETSLRAEVAKLSAQLKEKSDQASALETAKQQVVTALTT